MQQHYADYVNYLERDTMVRFLTTRMTRITEIKTCHWKHFSVRVYCQMAMEIMFSVLNIWLVSHIIVIIIYEHHHHHLQLFCLIKDSLRPRLNLSL